MKLNDVIVWLEEEFGAESDARVEVQTFPDRRFKRGADARSSTRGFRR